MDKQQKFFVCAALMLLAFSSSVLAADEHWQWGFSGFYGHETSASAKIQLVYAPYAALEREGLRIRYEGRVSGWDDYSPTAPRSYVIEAENSLYLGNVFHNGHWRLALYGGATVFSDTQFGLETRFGASGIVELVWSGNRGEFAAFEARASSIKNNWYVNFVSGIPTGFGDLKLGPEAGVGGNVTGWNARLGLAATGLTIGKYDLSLGIGALVDDEDRVSPYVSLWLSGQF